MTEIEINPEETAVTVISQNEVCDGWDVLCKLSDGRHITFHFPVMPEDLQSTVDALEPLYPAPMPEVPQPEIQPVKDSPIETEFKNQRDAAKVAAIGFIYTNPDCTEADIVANAQLEAPMLNGAYMIGLYVQSSFSNGYIAEPTFDSFKNFVLSRTPEQLMGM